MIYSHYNLILTSVTADAKLILMCLIFPLDL